MMSQSFNPLEGKFSRRAALMSLGSCIATRGLSSELFVQKTYTASTPAEGKIDWNAPTGRTAALQYGLNAFHALSPSVVADSAYRHNMAGMKAGMIRWHNGLQMNSSREEFGWVVSPDTSSYHWDKQKIIKALSSALDASGPFSYRPVKMLNIANWPAYLWDGGHLRSDAYDEYARFCAELVNIVIKEGRFGFEYVEIMNELDLGNKMYTGNMDEVGRIFQRVVATIKKVDPNIKVGGPAFVSPSNAINTEQFCSIAAPY